MSNDRERLAREWAVAITSVPNIHSAITQAAAEHILDTTTEPTMADVEWDDEKYRGAGATDTNGKTWVMSENDGGYINCTGLDMSTCGAPAEELTPNGKRYELVEVTGDEHPETLTTVEDYDQAPEGTIVAATGYLSTPLVKRYGKWRRAFIEFTAEELAPGDPVHVLRWGWGE